MTDLTSKDSSRLATGIFSVFKVVMGVIACAFIGIVSYFGYEYYQRETISQKLLVQACHLVRTEKIMVAAERGFAERHVIAPDIEYCLVKFHDGYKKLEIRSPNGNTDKLCYIGRHSNFLYEVIEQQPPYQDGERYKFVYRVAF